MASYPRASVFIPIIMIILASYTDEGLLDVSSFPSMRCLSVARMRKRRQCRRRRRRRRRS